MPPKFKFQDGERVLCFHGPLLYEAKCIKAQVKDKQVKYFIHYSGWNKNWDEWVPENRVLKINDANVQKQKELEKAHLKAKAEKRKSAKSAKDSSATTGGSSSPAPPSKVKKEGGQSSAGEGGGGNKGGQSASTAGSSGGGSTCADPAGAAATTTTGASGAPSVSNCGNTDPGGAPRKKRGRAEAHVETEEAFMSKMEIRVKIPDDLKYRLMDDWDYICRQKKLVQIPCSPTVDEILQDYLKQKTSAKGTTSNKESTIMEIVNGIREYFNVMHGKHLLYKFERPQYAQLLSEHPDAAMSTLYGAIHLLRMFTIIGTFLAYTNVDEKGIALLLTHMQDFLRYLSRNGHYMNQCQYVVASPEYCRRAL